jgi:hypothetical protein
MRRRNRFVRARQDEARLLRIVAMRLDSDRRAFDGPRPSPLRATLDRSEEIVE